MEGRRFAFTLAVALLAVAGVAWLRSSPPLPLLARALSGIAAGLLVAGIFIPGYLGPVQHAWMGLAHALSRVTMPILMAIVYFIVIAPIGLVRRAMGQDALKRTAAGNSFWVVRAGHEQRADIERQF